jgi:DNA-binding NtrC family response regulator
MCKIAQQDPGNGERLWVKSVFPLRALVSRQPGSTIFVFDDEPVIASNLVAILTLKGFRARCFTPPLEALRADRFEAQDTLMSDVMMPEVCRIDLAILMTEQFPNCRVLFFSGQSATSDPLKVTREREYDFRLLSKRPYIRRSILDESTKLIAHFAA